MDTFDFVLCLIGFFVLLIIVGFVEAIVNEIPSVKKKREEKECRSAGYDPNTEEGQAYIATSRLIGTYAMMKDMQRRSETRQIITNAAIGHGIAGNAGAVIGALTAKEKIESEKFHWE